MTTKQLIRLGLCLSLSLALHMVEQMLPLPSLPFPGVKLGFANLVNLAALFWFPFGQSVLLILLRCLLASFFGGGFSAFLFSSSGALLSFGVMWWLANRFSQSLSLPAISVAGAVAHNLAQILLSILLMQTFGLLIYLPVLILMGVLSGLAIGFTALLLLRSLQKSGRMPNYKEQLLPLLH